MEAARSSRCTSCGAQRQRAARFCPRCGAHQPTALPQRHTGRRTGPIGGSLLAITLIAAVVAAVAATDHAPRPSAPTAGVALPDAEVDLDSFTGRGPSPAPGVVPDTDLLAAPPLGAPAPHPEPAACRRGDRARSSCGPTLDLGHDTLAEVVVLREDLLVHASADELVAIDLPDGSERWRVAAFTGARSVRVADDGDLLVAAVRTGLVAIDPADGAIRWVTRFEDDATEATLRPRTREDTALVDHGGTDIATIPVWAGGGGVLAIDGRGRMHAFDRDDGARRWTRDLGRGATVTTTRGLLSVDREGLRLWHPDEAAVRWQRSGTDLWLHGAVADPVTRIPPQPVAGPLPLTSGRWLVDLGGGLIDLPDPGPMHVQRHGDVTVVVTWPSADLHPSAPTAGAARITAFDADGEIRWRQRHATLPCCALRSVPADGDRIAFIVDPRGDDDRPRPDGEGVAVVLDAADGTGLDVLRREGAELAALSGTTRIWREPTVLVGLDTRTGREAFRATGTIVAVAPLLIAGPDRTIVMRPDGPLAPSDVGRPGPRR